MEKNGAIELRFVKFFFVFFLLKASLFSIQAEFSDGVLKESSLSFPKGSYQEVIHKKAIFCKPDHYGSAWGHAVQDTIIPIYQHLRKKNLLSTPIGICIQIPHGKDIVVERATELLKTIFPYAEIKYLYPQSPPCFFEDIEIVRLGIPSNPNDGGVLIGRYMELMRSYGFADNVVVQLETPQWNVAHDFIEHVLNCYDLKNVQMVPKRICLVKKGPGFPRRILNLEQIAEMLRVYGYEVIIAEFDKMSVRDQILASRSSQFYISTHGAALTNTMFLHKDASAVIIWPENAKYFHNRFYCPFTSILLSRGIKLIEYDKPYSKMDIYTHFPIQVPEYFYQYKNRILLRPEKRNWSDILRFPLSCMYDIYNVNMFVANPCDLLWLIEH